MTPTKLSFRNEGVIKTFSEKHTEGLHHHQTCLTGNAKENYSSSKEGMSIKHKTL
jgi:hypothetical protein